jgi:acetyl esterase/lipase
MLCLSVMASAQQPAGGFGGLQVPQTKLATSQEWKDVNYAGDGQAYHTCDIYLPQKHQESYPVVIHIYGSAWFSNNSKGAADLGTIVRSLLDAGYAVVCPNHRSSMDAKWPAQLHDIRAVVRFVRGEAQKYHFDTSFIATSGFSSGAHLASITATTSGMKQAKVGTVDIDLEGHLGAYTSESSTVHAACDWSGPIDLTAMDCGEGMKMGENSPEDVLLNSKLAKEPDKYLSLSATTYVDKNDPPIIIFHGEKDFVVPCCQGKNFYEVLQSAGVKTEATFPAAGSHGGPEMYTEENLQQMVRFLDEARGQKQTAKSRIIEDGGTGRYKAVMTEVAGLPEHTVFQPQDLSAFDAQHPLPVLVWGNGACANSPWEHMNFLNEIASYGFIVLATGNIPMVDEWYKGPMSRTEQQIESLDWAIAQNADSQSPYYQKLDVSNICVAGMSCGGLQTLFNENGMDDFHRIHHVPAFAANFPVGHGGTYRQPHGGEFTVVALAWLQWQLQGDKQAAKLFVGKKCGLSKRQDWTVEHNKLFSKLK